MEVIILLNFSKIHSPNSIFERPLRLSQDPKIISLGGYYVIAGLIVGRKNAKLYSQNTFFVFSNLHFTEEYLGLT